MKTSVILIMSLLIGEFAHANKRDSIRDFLVAPIFHGAYSFAGNQPYCNNLQVYDWGGNMSHVLLQFGQSSFPRFTLYSELSGSSKFYPLKNYKVNDRTFIFKASGTRSGQIRLEKDCAGLKSVSVQITDTNVTGGPETFNIKCFRPNY